VSEDRLLDAVDELTRERTVHTTIIDDETGEWLRVHSEKHPPLITMLLEGTGISRGSASSDPGIPIDADALEMYSQMRDLIRLWCKKLGATFDDDLLASIRVWFLAHANAVRAGKVSEVIDHDVTRMVEGWVRMILNKFEPDEKREWTDPCPALIPVENEFGVHKRCGARRVWVNGDERFAIQLNVTKMTAECAHCHTRWVGVKEIMQLRHETNVAEAAKKDARVA